jgi:hypothetical protein
MGGRHFRSCRITSLFTNTRTSYFSDLGLSPSPPTRWNWISRWNHLFGCTIRNPPIANAFVSLSGLKSQPRDTALLDGGGRILRSDTMGWNPSGFVGGTLLPTKF